MRVLFICYPHVGIVKGGMYLQIIRTADALQNVGVEVVLHNPWDTDLATVDVCHFFSSHESLNGLYRAAVDRGLPTVWSTVFNVFSKSRLRLAAESLASRHLPGFLPGLKAADWQARSAQRIVALNTEERDMIVASFPCAAYKTLIIPNGIDHGFHGGDATAFRDHCQMQEGPYVLNVAYMCERKNQLHLIRAAKGQPWSLALVGRVDGSQYSQLCLDEARDCPNITIAGAFDSSDSLLRSAYAGAQVFCLPSYSEVQPLTLIEAAQNGCALVVSDAVPVQDFLSQHVLRVTPNDPAQIARCINEALQSNSSDVSAAVLQQPSWDDVAQDLVAVYRELAK